MTQSKLVVKRDGSIVPLDIAKIKKCIAWASEGLDVNELALESKFNEYLVPEMSTRTIQDSLITAARSLASRAEPDWTVVEGRLFTMNLWKERKTYEKTKDSFYAWVQEQTQKGEYKGPLVLDLFNKYTPEDFRYLSTLIDQQADLEQSYGSVFTAVQKYLTPSECIQQMFLVNAMIIASIEEAGNRVKFAEELYINMKDRKLSFASPWLSNLRIGGSIDSCFIIQPDDDINSIFHNVSNAAKISKAGGGLGISLSRIRAKGSEVNGRKNASKGVFGWARIFNDVALFVDQGGRRAGAFTVQLPVWHRDIEDFLEIQSETGDFRAKAYDIFPQVTVPDYFMELDKKDGKNIDWYTFCPHEVKTVLDIELYNVFGDDFTAAYHACVEAYKEGKLTVVGVHKVRDLFKHVMRTHFDSGLPYLGFIDEINRENPNNHIGNIPCVNLCTESFSTVIPDEYAHSCNLASIVVGRCKDLKEVKYLSGLLTRALDNGIELSYSPVREADDHSSDFRTIGIGIQGLHDWLAKEHLSYKNHTALSYLAEAIQYGAVKESIKLAEERGAYTHYQGSKWATGEMFKKYKSNPNSVQDWDSLENDLSLYGIRNSQLTSPAPNTTTSIFMDAGAGVMPVYMDFYQKDNGNGTFPFASMFLKENPLSYAKNASKWEHIHLVKSVSAIQQWTCAGVSAEFFLDHNKPDFNAKELYDLIHMAWEHKMKAIYYIRHIKKGKQYHDAIGVLAEATCDGCSG